MNYSSEDEHEEDSGYEIRVNTSYKILGKKVKCQRIFVYTFCRGVHGSMHMCVSVFACMYVCVCSIHIYIYNISRKLC